MLSDVRTCLNMKCIESSGELERQEQQSIQVLVKPIIISHFAAMILSTDLRFSTAFILFLYFSVSSLPQCLSMRVMERFYCPPNLPLRIIDMKLSHKNVEIGYFFECENPPLQIHGAFMSCRFVKRNLNESFLIVQRSNPFNVSAEDPIEFFFLDDHGSIQTSEKEKRCKAPLFYTQVLTHYLSLLYCLLSICECCCYVIRTIRLCGNGIFGSLFTTPFALRCISQTQLIGLVSQSNFDRSSQLQYWPSNR
jgi:hypothetical protein